MPDVEFGFVASAADAPGTPDHELYRTVLDDVEYHAGLGYTTAWLIEHHFSDYFPTPSPLVLASHIAARIIDDDAGSACLGAAHIPGILVAEIGIGIAVGYSPRATAVPVAAVVLKLQLGIAPAA